MLNIKASKLKYFLFLTIVHIIVICVGTLIIMINIYFSIFSYETLFKFNTWIIVMFFTGILILPFQSKIIITINDEMFGLQKGYEQLYDFSLLNVKSLKIKNYYLYESITINYFNESIVLYSFEFYKDDFQKILKALSNSIIDTKHN